MVYSFEGTVNTDWDCFTLGVIEREMTQSRRKILWLLDQFEKEIGSSQISPLVVLYYMLIV